MGAFVFGWKHSSGSAKLLARTLGAPFSCPRDEYHVMPGKNDVVINWGGGMGAHFMDDHKTINKPEAIAKSVDKLTTFHYLQRAGVPIPELTEDARQAFKWVREGHIVFGRQALDLRAGKGIVLFAEEKLPDAEVDEDNPNPRVQVRTIDDITRYRCQAYTKRFNGKWELKVHVAFGKVHMVWSIDEDTEDYTGHDGLIRNYNNGYIFNYASERVKNQIHKSVWDNCIKAIKSLGLDFGVVDIQVAANGRDMVVFETNTAPAIDEDDAQLYAEMFRRELKIR